MESVVRTVHCGKRLRQRARGTQSISRQGFTLTSGTALVINTNVSLIGSGSSTTIIEAAGVSRVFTIMAGSVSIESVTVRNGQGGDGGGIDVDNQGTLTLNNVTVTGNTASAWGGASA